MSSPLVQFVGADPIALRQHHLSLAAEARRYAAEERSEGSHGEALSWDAQALAHERWADEYGPAPEEGS